MSALAMAVACWVTSVVTGGVAWGAAAWGQGQLPVAEIWAALHMLLLFAVGFAGARWAALGPSAAATGAVLFVGTAAAFLLTSHALTASDLPSVLEADLLWYVATVVVLPTAGALVGHALSQRSRDVRR